MTLDQETKFVAWFKDLILAFEQFFHKVQAWLDGTIYPSEWFQNLIAEEDESTTGA
ncbi:MAG: hypothetical protein IJK89_04305 [Clostridia bacterium]|nr:hypothetical protein [Clostridia bacterium]